MANKWMQAYIDTRRSKGKATPWANWVDTRREYDMKTPYADWLGYDSPDPIPPGPGDPANPPLTEAEACAARPGYQWVYDPVTRKGNCLPVSGGTIPDTKDLPDVDKLPDNLKPQNLLDPDKYGKWITKDETPLPYTQLGAYQDAFQQMLKGPAFGNQTLEELEQARIDALQGDLANQYGFQADEMQRRLNAQAEASGMYGSSQNLGNIQRGLSDIGRQQQVEFAKGSADIRGQRPELLLKEREQRANIANMWGQMDLDSQKANLDAMLNNKTIEYQRMLNNGELSLSAFNGNVNQLSLFLDYMVSSAKTDNERYLINANIDKIYNDMNDDEKRMFWDWIADMSGSMGGGFGKG